MGEGARCPERSAYGGGSSCTMPPSLCWIMMSGWMSTSSGAETSGCELWFLLDRPGRGDGGRPRDDAVGLEEDDAVERRCPLEDASSALRYRIDGSEDADAGDLPPSDDEPEGSEMPEFRCASTSSRSKYTGGMGVTSSRGVDAFVVGDPSGEPS